MRAQAAQNKVLVLQHTNLMQIDLSELWLILMLSGSENNQAKGSTLRRPLSNSLIISETAANWLHHKQIDFAILPDVAFSQIKLIVSDMDSTLITIECIDEIAARLNLKEQVATITERSMRGELDFSASLIERVELLKGLPESELGIVYQEKVRLTQGAEELIAEAKKAGIKFMLVSGGFTFFTRRLKEKLNLEYAFANQLEVIDGKLTGKVVGSIVDANTKARLLKQYQQELNLQANQVLAIGDGANDIPMIQAAGFGIAFHAKEKVKQHALICINYNGLESIRHYFS